MSIVSSSTSAAAEPAGAPCTDGAEFAGNGGAPTRERTDPGGGPSAAAIEDR